MKRVVVGALATCAAITCVPSLGSDDSLISRPRILAVRAVPAEATPGTKVTFTPFAVSPTGPLASPAIAWDFCAAPLPLTSDNVVANACLGSGSLVPAGLGPTLVAAMPKNACAIFGPDTPPSGNFRPADPDATGGYYQPLRANLAGSETAFDLARIRCDLANAPASAASAFAAAYVANANPTLLPPAITLAGTVTARVPVSANVSVSATWPASSAETFAYFNPSSQTIASQRESLQVAWYATAGAFATESTGRASTDLATSSENTWTAPSTPGSAFLYIVLRDSRGGVDFASVELTVGP